jgi:hypothetical protein
MAIVAYTTIVDLIKALPLWAWVLIGAIIVYLILKNLDLIILIVLIYLLLTALGVLPKPTFSLSKDYEYLKNATSFIQKIIS